MSDQPAIPPRTELLPRIEGRVAAEYFNGFEIGIGPGDIVFVLMRNNERRIVLNCSLTIARGLAKGIIQAVESMEEATGFKSPSLEDLYAARPKLESLKKQTSQEEGPK